MLAIAGLSLVALLALLYLSITVPIPVVETDPLTATDPSAPWLIVAFPVANVLCWLALGVSLIVYCVQWAVTLISAVMENHRSASS